MPAFTKSELDYDRIDVRALLELNGIIAIKHGDLNKCRQWLGQTGYTRLTLDCSQDFKAVKTEFGKLMNWEHHFGYAYENGGGGWDALHDGFQINVPRKGLVFELYRADILWKNSHSWVNALLHVISGHSQYHLALGKRFFGLVIVGNETTFKEGQFPYTFFQNPMIRSTYSSHFHSVASNDNHTKESILNIVTPYIESAIIEDGDNIIQLLIDKKYVVEEPNTWHIGVLPSQEMSSTWLLYQKLAIISEEILDRADIEVHFIIGTAIISKSS
jgi:hypothetical protein